MDIIEVSQPPAKPTKSAQACVTCHRRKVKCDASTIGLPCSRCISSSCPDTCVFVSHPKGTKRKRAKPQNPLPAADTNNSIRQPLTRPNVSSQDRIFQLSTTDVSPRTSVSVPTAPQTTRSQPTPSYSGDCGPSKTRLQPDERAADQDENAVQEDEAQLQTCRQMSQWMTESSSPTLVEQSPRHGREVIEYHEGVSSISILSETFANKPRKKLIRLVLSDPASKPGSQTVAGGIDEADWDYLQRKGALVLPSRPVLGKFLRLWFTHVYPYVPVVDRVDFVRKFNDGVQSNFLLQCIMASVIPYTSTELLSEAGLSDHHAAQKIVYARALLLHDVGAETRQLPLLQGSIILSQLQLSFALNKDYRFWHSNALRLATQMGLHRNDIMKELEVPTRCLFRRLWWTIYHRDVLLCIFGNDNVRKVNDRFSDTSPLEESDWEEQAIPKHLEQILSPITRLEKLFFIETCKLSQISTRHLDLLRAPRHVATKTECLSLERSFVDWRQALPFNLRIESVSEWSHSNVWILVLFLRSFLTECIFHRSVNKYFGEEDAEFARRAKQKLHHALFEIDMILERVLLCNVAPWCPLFLSNCIGITIALHIEKALDPSMSSFEKLVARTRIHTHMSILRSLRDHWSPVSWTLRMHEVIIARTSLDLPLKNEADFGNSLHPFDKENDSIYNNTGINCNVPGPNGVGNNGNVPVADGLSAANPGMEQDDFNTTAWDDDLLGNYMGMRADDWVQDLLGYNDGNLHGSGAIMHHQLG